MDYVSVSKDMNITNGTESEFTKKKKGMSFNSFDIIGGYIGLLEFRY